VWMKTGGGDGSRDGDGDGDDIVWSYNPILPRLPLRHVLSVYHIGSSPAFDILKSRLSGREDFVVEQH
jgi:hypothetical protein